VDVTPAWHVGLHSGRVSGAGLVARCEALLDVAAWLRGLGLERYERAFRDNEIDADLLPNLTADDLKDLGVSLVGYRRRLLDAIAALGAPEHDMRQLNSTSTKRCRQRWRAAPKPNVVS
jgi:SAM domain (Sterile alpha motif)